MHLSNHLGNVLVTVSDRKLAEGTEGSTATGYRAEVLFASDYYPFGMQMPGREFSAEEYRYGFQGQETDKEWLGGAVSYKYRVHDARIGRFLSVDPLAPIYSFNSPYSFSQNSTVAFVELEGLEAVPAGKNQMTGYNTTAVLSTSVSAPIVPPGFDVPDPMNGAEWPDVGVIQIHSFDLNLSKEDLETISDVLYYSGIVLMFIPGMQLVGQVLKISGEVIELAVLADDLYEAYDNDNWIAFGTSIVSTIVPGKIVKKLPTKTFDSKSQGIIQEIGDAWSKGIGDATDAVGEKLQENKNMSERFPNMKAIDIISPKKISSERVEPKLRGLGITPYKKF
jgi:RHS repeat-associated protein